jgi:hypothetical protein
LGVPGAAAGAGVAAFGAEHAARSETKVKTKVKAKIEVEGVWRLEADLNRRIASVIELISMPSLVPR